MKTSRGSFIDRIRSCFQSPSLIFTMGLSAFEWYDFALFGYLSPVMGRVFFPQSDPLTALLSSFAVLASGFLMRPLGALWLGGIGDRRCPKRALSYSLALMSIPTMALGLLPSYETWGLGATVALVVIRLCQGLAVGGNYGGTLVTSVRQAPHRNMACLASSLVLMGTIGGLLLGVGVVTTLQAISDSETFVAWIWRVPFWCSGLMAWALFYAHKDVPKMEAERERTQRSPWRDLLGRDRWTFLQVILLILLDGVGIYILFIFMTSYATTLLHLPETPVMVINTTCMTLLTLSIPVWGWWGDHVSPHRILKGVSMAFLLLPLPLFGFLLQAPSLERLWILQIIFAVVMGAVYGTLPYTVVKTFSPSLRYTACGMAFNVSLAFLGGNVPWLVTYGIRQTHNLMIPAFLLSIVGIVSYVSLGYLGRQRQRRSDVTET